MTAPGRRNGRKTNRKVERSQVSDLSNTVALAVWYLMRKNGITSGNQLAAELDVPQATINRKLNGRGEFDLGDIAILAEFFDVSAVELIAGARLGGQVTLAP
ncbi:helix-turn-helix transcriptional regulator [Fodinicola feengrottensis]